MSRTQVQGTQILDGTLDAADLQNNTVTDAKLSLTGVAAGTYKSLTVSTSGRVTAGTNPTTLSGYGITDAQGLNSNLTSLASNVTAGLLTLTSTGTIASRTLTAGSSKIAITNGNGVSGNPTVDVTEASLTLNNIGGTLSVAKGGTNLTALGTANQLLGVNSGVTALEYKSIIGGSGISISNSAGSITISKSSATAGQIISVSIPQQTSTGVIAYSTTTPLSTDGSLLATITITPTSSTSTFTGSTVVSVGAQNNDRVVTITAWRGTTLVGLAATWVSNTGRIENLGIQFSDSPATASAITYTLRIGLQQSGTTYINRDVTNTYGGTSGVKTAFTIFESL